VALLVPVPRFALLVLGLLFSPGCWCVYYDYILDIVMDSGVAERHRAKGRSIPVLRVTWRGRSARAWRLMDIVALVSIRWCDLGRWTVKDNTSAAPFFGARCCAAWRCARCGAQLRGAAAPRGAV